MFFVASKLLAFLLNPLLWIVIGFIYSWKAYERKSGKVVFKSSILLLLILSNPILSNLALKYYEYSFVAKDELPLSDVGIVLSGITYADKSPKDQIHLNGAADRITEAMRLYNDGIISSVLITGGSGAIIQQETKESGRLRELALLGVNENHIIIEPEARNTRENAHFSSALLNKKSLSDRNIILITSALHMKRALACFQKAGLDVIPYPVDYQQSQWNIDVMWIIPSTGSISTWSALVKEIVGLWTYKLMGYA